MPESLKLINRFIHIQNPSVLKSSLIIVVITFLACLISWTLSQGIAITLTKAIRIEGADTYDWIDLIIGLPIVLIYTDFHV